MQLPDLNFLTRFKHLFDFDSHHLTIPEGTEKFASLMPEDREQLASLIPTLDEHQKLIVDRIKKRGLEFDKKMKSKPAFWPIPRLLLLSPEFDQDRLLRDFIFVRLDNWMNDEEPSVRYYQSVGSLQSDL